MTIQEQWRKYRDQCYPEGISGVQNAECHQAFFAGASIALGFMDDISKLPTGEAVKQLHALCMEAAEVLEARANAIKHTLKN
jgi:hypothetical protein